jgi:hypothetical protein
MRAILPLVLAAFGCTDLPARRPAADSSAVVSTVADTARPSAGARELVQPETLPPAVRTACDSATAFMREALGLDIRREDGRGEVGK